MGVGIPKIVCTLEVPARFEDITKRHHNRIAKDAVRNVLEYHWKHRIPLHFRQDARGRYGYKPRSEKYKALKNRRFRSRRDLVLTGASEERMKREHRITVGGTAEKGTLTGTLIVAFSWVKRVQAAFAKKARFARRLGVSADALEPSKPRAKPSVTIQDMKREIQRMTPDEIKDVAAQFRAEYMRLAERLRSGRKRVRAT